ncbi:MAG: C-type lectin domain-containing protein [Polyangiaceae bacterium]
MAPVAAPGLQGRGPRSCPRSAPTCAGSSKAVLDIKTGHCYYLSKSDGHHWSWDASRDWCQNEWDGDLAVFEVDDERLLLAPQLPKEWPTERMWVGREEGPADQFTWVSGGAVPTDPALWGDDEPNRGGSDCLAIGSDGLSYDVDCGGELTHHICERGAAGEL